nr:insulin chain B - bovine (fragments) [Bos indicus x Bos taurus]
ALYLVCGE